LTDNPPDIERDPEDLARFAEDKMNQFADAAARHDSAAAIGHLLDLAAEGDAQLANQFAGGLAEAGLRNLAATPFEDEADERRRSTFLALNVLRPRHPQPGRWSAGQERWYLLTRASVFAAYVLAHTEDPDSPAAELYRTAAALTANDLIVWDHTHDTRIGPLQPYDEEFRADPSGYVAQETAIEGY
jgi:hypothetical protein